jgi:hypothetical protein
MKKIWLMSLAIILGLSACSSNNPSTPSQNDRDNGNLSQEIEQEDASYEEFALDLSSGPANLKKLKMSLANLGAFKAVFTLEFDGRDDWSYQVETRYDGRLIEYSLHIEGVPEAHNPGDLRLVNNDGINQMIGPGTDNSCVQFPDDMKTGALFLSPVDFINPDVLLNNWDITEGDIYLDREAAAYSTEQDYYYGWENIEVDFLLDTQTGAILSYLFNAVGSDPLYDFGGGAIHGNFNVIEIGPQNIEPVKGCEIPLPIPSDAYNIIILPGVYSYQSNLGPVKTDNHFGQVLPPLGWTRDTAVVNDAIREGYLIYKTDKQTLTVHIQAINPEDFSEGYLVRLYLEENTD